MQVVVVTLAVLIGVITYGVAEVMGYDELPDILQGLDVGHERSVQTYLSTINLLLAAVLLFVVYNDERAGKRPLAGYWLFLAALFLFLSFDEFASIHEKYRLIYAYFVSEEMRIEIFDSHQWLPIGIVFVLVVFVVLLPFLKALKRQTRRNFLVAGFVFLAGAIGFEFIGALMLSEGIVDSRSDLLYRARRIVEESLEMYGIVIFNCALYREVLLNANQNNGA